LWWRATLRITSKRIQRLKRAFIGRDLPIAVIGPFIGLDCPVVLGERKTGANPHVAAFDVNATFVEVGSTEVLPIFETLVLSNRLLADMLRTFPIKGGSVAGYAG
jgi:hypothetical protein